MTIERATVSTNDLRSLNFSSEFAPSKGTETRRHSIADFRFKGRIASGQLLTTSNNSLSKFNKQEAAISSSVSNCPSSEVIPQMYSIITDKPMRDRSVVSVDITANKSENTSSITYDSEWNSGMPLTPVGSIMFDELENSEEHTNDLLTTSSRSATIATQTAEIDGIINITTNSKTTLLHAKIQRVLNDLINVGILNIKQLPDQNPEAGTIYEFITTALASGENSVAVLYDRIKLELNFILQLVEDNNYNSIKEIIGQLNTENCFANILSSIATDDTISNVLRPVIRANINKAVNNNKNYVSSKEINKFEELLMVYCLAIGRIKIDDDLYKDIEIPLHNQPLADKPVWRTSASQYIDKILSPAAMLILHMVYWAMTIANSTREGHFSNNFPNENIIGTIMAAYCSIAITHGSVMNSIRIYRSGQTNPEGSKALMWSSIFLNTLKDATSLGGSVLSLINIPPYIPLFQGANLLFSTMFAQALIYRAKEANSAQFDSQKLKLFAPAILIPSILLGTASITLPHCLPNAFEQLFGYNGGDTGFFTHSLKSLVSNLLTTSNEGLKEANRVLILISLCASFSVNNLMFVDISRCEDPKLKKELQSFKGYLVFRYLVTAFTAIFSMTDPYSPSGKIAEQATTEALKFASTVAKMTNSTVASSPSTTNMPTEVAETVGALYVFLSTCDTAKGIVWEPRVGSFNRQAIKNVLKNNQLQNLEKQFKDTTNNMLVGNESTGDYIATVFQALRKIGFADKLEKMQATEFEPDLYEIVNTVINTLTVSKTTHNKNARDNNLGISSLFSGVHIEETGSGVGLSDNQCVVDINQESAEAVELNFFTASSGIRQPSVKKCSDEEKPLLNKKGACNEIATEFPQVTSGRFTVVMVDDAQ